MPTAFERSANTARCRNNKTSSVLVFIHFGNNIPLIERDSAKFVVKVAIFLLCAADFA
jgi:hypothetical protein